MSGEALLALWFLFGSALPVPAQQVSGRVRDRLTLGGVPGAELRLEPGGLRTYSDSLGRFDFQAGPGAVTGIEVRRVGYRPVRLRLRPAAEPGFVEILLDPVPIEIDSVTVRAPRPIGSGYEGMADRMRRGTGRFLSDSLLRQSEHLQLVTLLRREGVEVVGANAVGRGRCRLTVYFDGIRLRDPPPLSTLSVFGLRGVEVYSSLARIPPEFDGLDQTCGVLVLWTRKG